VVANRLSELEGWSVLLLEAGADESEASDIPVLANALQKGLFDWQYQTEPQPGRACLGLEGGRMNWPRGKVLGGSSVLNYMLYVRGNKVGRCLLTLGPTGSSGSLFFSCSDK